MKRRKGHTVKTDWLLARREAKAMGMGYIEIPADIYLQAPHETAPRRRYLRMGQSIHSTIVWALQTLGVAQEHYFRAQALDLVEAVNDARVRSGLDPVALDFASLARKDRLRWASSEMAPAIQARGKVGRRKRFVDVHENDGTPYALKDPTPNGLRPGRKKKNVDGSGPVPVSEDDQSGEVVERFPSQATGIIQTQEVEAGSQDACEGGGGRAPCVNQGGSPVHCG